MRDLPLSHHHTPTPKIKGDAAHIPLVHTVQQPYIGEKGRDAEFQSVSRRRSERWRLRTPSKRAIVQRLRKLEHDDAHKLEKCCSQFVVTTCGVHSTKFYPTFRCKKAYCPDCAAERARRLATQTEAKIREVMKTTKGRLCFLTLTTTPARTLEAGLNRLKKAFAAFKRKKAFKEHILGYTGGFEYTFNEKTGTFHVHLHLNVLRGRFWKQSDISATWREVTGDSFIVDIREAKDIHESVKELCKYIVKGADLTAMPDEAFRQVVDMKKGTRMFVSGGCFYNVKLDADADEEAGDVFNQFADLRQGDNCPFCGDELFDVFTSRDSAVGLYELNAMPGIVKRNSS